MKKMIKALIIFGAGLYTGVYVGQNYQDAVSGICKKTAETCEKATKTWLAFFVCFSLIDKVEDPKVLFERAQSYVKCKLAEFSENSKKGDK